jgi:hypothetical protein
MARNLSPEKRLASGVPDVSKLFALDRRIRYAQVISSDGRILSGGMREGLESLDPPELRTKRVHQFVENRQLISEWADRYGKHSYALFVFDRIKLFVFPLDEDKTLFVSVASSIRRSSVERILADFLSSSIL